MELEAGIVDLERLSLSSGQAQALELKPALAPVELAGQSYEAEGGGAAGRLDVSRTTSGWALRLRYETPVTGPCVRCLEPARIELSVDAREVDQPSAQDEELRSPYVIEGRLEVERWANDAMVLGLPSQPLCRPDCAGLCAVCGISLNGADPSDHEHGGGGDPRMAKLRDLEL
ncbi:MAG: DUF177 domain-containing protein [Actinobacteria bacterium]|nr:DUF177 domain-containing protein [Actinomycetota bacterium]